MSLDLEIVDPNDDAKSAALVQAMLDKILRYGIDGAGPIKGAEQVAREHLVAHGDPEVAIERLIRTHARVVTAAGFASGVGGIVTMAVTIPADLTALYVGAARCSAAIAVLRGYDVRSEEVRSVVLLSLLGASGAEIAGKVGVDLGNRAALAALRKLPGSALIQINRRVGFRLLTKFGTKGVINLGKAVPLAGGGVSAAMNYATLRGVAKYSRSNFPALTLAPPPVGVPESSPEEVVSTAG